MGSIIKKKTGWAIRFDMPESTKENRKQKQISGFKTKNDAQRALNDIEFKINNNNYRAESNMTVSEFYNLWFKDHVANLAPKTNEFYSRIIKLYIDPYIGHVQLNQLRPNDIQALYKTIDTTNANRVKIHKTLKASLNLAYKWDYVDKKIMDKIIAPKATKKEMKYWKPNEIKIALENFKDTNIFFHVNVALNLGLRLGEICALTFEDVDYKNKVLSVSKTLQVIGKDIIIKPPKTEKGNRKIPLTNNMMAFFKQEMAKRKENYPYYKSNDYMGYFSVFEDGSIKNDKYVSRSFHKLLLGMDLPMIRFHDQRHSCASWLIYNDVDLKVIQEILGHASFDITANTYSHIDLDKKREALERLNF